MIGYIKGRGLLVEFPNFHMTCPYPVDLYLLMLTSWYRACVVGMNIAILISEWEKKHKHTAEASEVVDLCQPPKTYL